MSSEASNPLVAHLCLEAGRLMENASAELARVLPTDPHARTTHLQRMQKAAIDIASLVEAAAALDRRASDTD
jgi:hypothetical protein